MAWSKTMLLYLAVLFGCWHGSDAFGAPKPKKLTTVVDKAANTAYEGFGTDAQQELTAPAAHAAPAAVKAKRKHHTSG
jgi:hypothetical protein